MVKCQGLFNIAIILLAFRFENNHHAQSEDDEEENMSLSDDDSDDILREGEIEEELEVENEEELSVGCDKENVSMFKFREFKYFKLFQSPSKT